MLHSPLLLDASPLGPGATFDTTQAIPLGLAVGEYLIVLQGGPEDKLEALASTTLAIETPPNSPPEAICRDRTIPTDPGGCTANTSVNNGSFDPDGDPLTLAQLPLGPYSLGTTSVALMVTDDSSAFDSCTATVAVVDRDPPIITCPASQITECTGSFGASVSFIATAADHCTVNPSINCNPASGSSFALGITTDTCTVIDESGNQNTCTFPVNVVDTAAPVPDLDPLPIVTGELSAEVPSSPTATDVCMGTIIGTTSNPLSYSEQGTFTVAWIFDDGNGNTSTQTQTVTVQEGGGACEVIPVDFDGDCDVDRNDLTILLADRNKSVEESACGAPCDLDGDGQITALDTRKLVLLCTRARCATED